MLLACDKVRPLLLLGCSHLRKYQARLSLLRIRLLRRCSALTGAHLPLIRHQDLLLRCSLILGAPVPLSCSMLTGAPFLISSGQDLPLHSSLHLGAQVLLSCGNRLGALAHQSSLLWVRLFLCGLTQLRAEPAQQDRPPKVKPLLPGCCYLRKDLSLLHIRQLLGGGNAGRWASGGAGGTCCCTGAGGCSWAS